MTLSASEEEAAMRLSAFLGAILLHPSDPDFPSAVHRAAGEPPPQPKVGTFEALIRDYNASPEWRGLSDASRRDYGRYLDGIERDLGRFLNKLVIKVDRPQLSAEDTKKLEAGMKASAD